MFKMTFTLAAALYAGFVIWGQPADMLGDDAVADAPVVAGDGDFDSSNGPIIMTNASSPATVVTRAAMIDAGPGAIPDAAAIAASAPPAPTTFADPSLIQGPMVVSFVSPEIPAEPTEVETASVDVMLRVSGSRVNMRSGPSTSNAVVDSLPQGTLTERLGEPVDGWVEIRDVSTGLTGFMSARFLDPA